MKFVKRNLNYPTMKSKILNSIFILLLFFEGRSQQWEVMERIGFSESGTMFLNLVLDHYQVPYLVFRDSRFQARATVMKFNGEKWELVGQRAFSEGDAYNTTITFDSKNIPYVAFTDSGNEGKITVMKLKDNIWVPVGSPGFTPKAGSFTSLAIYNDMPYVAFRDFSQVSDRNDFKGSVMGFNGSTWEYVGRPGFTDGGGVGNTKNVFDSKGTPYITYTQIHKDFKPSIQKFDGYNWIFVSMEFSDSEAGDINIAIDSNDTLYVAFWDRAQDGKATVMKFDGSNWIPVGKKGCTPAAVNCLTFSIKDDKPYLAFQDLACRDTMYNSFLDEYYYGYTRQASAMVFEDGEWKYFGEPCFSASDAWYTSIAVADNGTVFVAYSDITSEPYKNAATVMRFGEMPPLEAKAEKKSEMGFWVYPNPTHSNFTIHYQSESPSPVTFKVRTLTGTIIYEAIEQKPTGKIEKQINLGSPAPGVYYVEVISDGERVVKKVVVGR
jgi:hypothetical protein